MQGIKTTKRNVLLVNIISNDRRMINLLKGLDYDVSIASSSDDVTKMALESPPSVILLSLKMQETDGLTCLTHIKKDTQLGKVPVVMVSEKEDIKILQGSLKQGASAYLVKPIGFTSLYCVIQKLTEKRPRENLRARVIFKVALWNRASASISLTLTGRHN
jgi:DNA-binding NtrC family response regulator